MLEQENLDSAESNFLEEYYIAFFVKCRFRQSRFVLNLDQIKERFSSVPDQLGKQSWGLHAGAKGAPSHKAAGAVVPPRFTSSLLQPVLVSPLP